MNRLELLAKAKAEREVKDWASSANTLAPWVTKEPQDTAAAYYYAMALLEIGQANKARGYFERLIGWGKHLPQAHYMLARSFVELDQLEAAYRHFETAHQLGPTDLTLRAVAKGAWMAGDMDRFGAVLSSAGGTQAVVAYGLFVEAERYQEAEDLWARLPTEMVARAESQVLRSRHMRQIGDGPAADIAAQRAALLTPDAASVVDAFAVAKMMIGDAHSALRAIEPMRLAQPNNQYWIAHEATVLRLLGDPRYETLMDFDRFVRSYRLPVPEGYADSAAFNRALQAELETHHHASNHPLDQSLRLGTQTAQDLLAMESPAVRAYIKALKVPVSQYIAEIGQGHEHPLTARNTGQFTIKGCWSVRLTAGGHHVNHVHPQGWISSAYYVSVPSGQDERGGWIKFGQPPFETNPPMMPEKWVQPARGMLVLFPSYMWHGTHPIGAGEPRMTAPFDVVPA
ncbi:MAG: 2OG-Fe(II) oxygenase family protein [Pseudomonadota bacterium]